MILPSIHGYIWTLPPSLPTLLPGVVDLSDNRALFAKNISFIRFYHKFSFFLSFFLSLSCLRFYLSIYMDSFIVFSFLSIPHYLLLSFFLYVLFFFEHLIYFLLYIISFTAQDCLYLNMRFFCSLVHSLNSFFLLFSPSFSYLLTSWSTCLRQVSVYDLAHRWL